MSTEELSGALSNHQVIFLVVALVVAFAFEFINGFHDTANAVATVIYTKSLRPWSAVIWSGIWNFLGVSIGGIGVAYSIVNLLPVDLLVNINGNSGHLMILAILIAAASWNLGTWYLGLPASSSHTLIGSILGVGLTHSILLGHGFSGINWTKAIEVGLSLLISPLIGFVLAGALLVLGRHVLRNPDIHQPPRGDQPPPRWVRAILLGTCTGVSFAHGSNDGQKGMGLIMLILIGTLPAHFALNLAPEAGSPRELAASAEAASIWVAELGADAEVPVADLSEHLLALSRSFDGAETFAELPVEGRWSVRRQVLELKQELSRVESAARQRGRTDIASRLASLRKELSRPIEYVPDWVILGVAMSLGAGTMIGWKRIVVTVAEKIGKQHLTYSQGACAELVAMTTIGLADISGLPVSTTHVLSSGIAGTMWANRAGIQVVTVRRIALAWVLTMPAAMLLSSTLFVLGKLAWA